MSGSDRPVGGLEPDEVRRYSRHLTLPQVGVEGQLRLRASRVLIVGAGGLGSPLSMYLAAAGVGTIGLVDFDRVDASNLQRQLLYGTEDIGEPKVERAADRLRSINPHVDVVPHALRLSARNAREVLGGYDIVVDGTDNFPTRYLVNDACVLLGKPNVYGSVFRFEGQVSLFRTPDGPCYRCLYPEPPPPGSVPNCAEGGVLGILPGIIGTLQATETIKLVLGLGDSLVGRLVLFDALEMRFRELKLRRDPACPICGDSPTIRDLADTEASCAVPAVGGAVSSIDVQSLRARIDAGDSPQLLDVRTPEEWAICRIEGARLIPLAELEGRLDELDSRREVVVYCHTGRRSATATSLLADRGFTAALNLLGGIDAWAAEIDRALPRY